MAKTPGVVASCSCHACPTLIAPFLSSIPHLATFPMFPDSHDDATTRHLDHLASDKPLPWQSRVEMSDQKPLGSRWLGTVMGHVSRDGLNEGGGRGQRGMSGLTFQ